MKNGHVELELIQNLLQATPRGMTISEISEKLGYSRNSTAKYLEMLLMAGKVDLHTFGRSKIFTLSHAIAAATVLSLSSDLIVFFDARLKIIDTNDQFLRFVGQSRAQVVGYTLEEINVGLLMHRDILLNVKDGLQGKEVIREILFRKGQEDFYFKVKILPIEVSDDKGRIAIVFEDITVRKKAEIALKESEARYRAVVEDQTELICRMTPDTAITFVNEAWCKFFKQPRTFFMGKKHFDLIPPEYRSDYLQILHGIKISKPDNSAEFNICLADGKTRWINATIRGFFASSGLLTELQIVGRDITDRRQLELVEQQSEARYMAIVDSQIDMISRHAPDMTITFANEACARFWGIPRDELIGMSLKAFFPPEDYLKIMARIARIRVDMDQEPFEDIELYLKGTRYWFQWSCSGIFDERGVLVEYQIVSHEITGRMRSELAENAMREKMWAIIDQLPLALCIATSDLRCLHANRELCQLTGYSEPELLSGACGNLINLAGDRESEPMRNLLDGNVDRYQTDRPCVRADGSSMILRREVRLANEAAGVSRQFICIFTRLSHN